MPNPAANKLRFSSIFGLLLVPISIWPSQARPDDIVIGMSAAFQGSSRGLGIEVYRGAMAYFEHINRMGGVHGRHIIVKAYDDGYDPDKAIDNTIRLIEQDKVLLLFGYVGTPTVTRVLPMLQHAQNQSVYLFFPFTGAEPQRRPPYQDYVFNLRASYGDETAGLVDNFVRIGRKRIGIFYQIDAYGRSGWDGARAALAKHGLRLTEEATYRRGVPFTESMQAQVMHLRQSDADAVICIGSYAACAAFIRDARDLGWDVPIANVSFVGSENLLAQLTAHGKAVNQDYVHDLVNSQVVPSYDDVALPAVRQYRDFMEKYQPGPPAAAGSTNYATAPLSFVGLEGFLDAKLLVEVLARMGPNPTRQVLRSAAESIGDFDLGIGVSVTFGAKRHQGLNQVYFTTVGNGRFGQFSDWSRWQK